MAVQMTGRCIKCGATCVVTISSDTPYYGSIPPMLCAKHKEKNMEEDDVIEVVKRSRTVRNLDPMPEEIRIRIHNCPNLWPQMVDESMKAIEFYNSHHPSFAQHDKVSVDGSDIWVGNDNRSVEHILEDVRQSRIVRGLDPMPKSIEESIRKNPEAWKHLSSCINNRKIPIYSVRKYELKLAYIRLGSTLLQLITAILVTICLFRVIQIAIFIPK